MKNEKEINYWKNEISQKQKDLERLEEIFFNEKLPKFLEEEVFQLFEKDFSEQSYTLKYYTISGGVKVIKFNMEIISKMGFNFEKYLIGFNIEEKILCHYMNTKTEIRFNIKYNPKNKQLLITFGNNTALKNFINFMFNEYNILVVEEEG